VQLGFLCVALTDFLLRSRLLVDLVAVAISCSHAGHGYVLPPVFSLVFTPGFGYACRPVSLSAPPLVFVREGDGAACVQFCHRNFSPPGFDFSATGQSGVLLLRSDLGGVCL
jgi:hypothetical protein